MGDIIFVTLQPDVPYFHWQVKPYTYNFIEEGIKPCQIYVIFGLQNKRLNQGVFKLCDYSKIISKSLLIAYNLTHRYKHLFGQNFPF